MGQRTIPGLILRAGIWHVQKRIGSTRIRESTGTSDVREAERYLIHRFEEIRQASVYGVRPTRTFNQAALRYLREERKASLAREAKEITVLVRFIGDVPLSSLHMGSLHGYIEERRKKGNRTRTINYGLQVVRRILNLAAQEWIDEYGLSWLAHAPKIRLLKQDDRQEPYPLSWNEQDKLFALLPEHLRLMALFKVNAGCRDQEVCNLRWEWEVEIPALNTSVFIIPKSKVKNREDRLVVLNRVARAAIEEVRGRHEEFVFTYRGRPLRRMRNKSWLSATKKAGLPHVRVHDLKHTFGRRLRAAGVSFEDRQDLLGHKSGRITTHYSAPELLNLIQAAERVCEGGGHKMDTMVILKKKPRLALVG